MEILPGDELMNIVDALERAYWQLKEKADLEAQQEVTLIIRAETLQTYFNLWEVDNLTDLLNKMAKYEWEQAVNHENH